MLLETATIRNKKPRGETRFPGIGKDADTLGVARVTLYKVLAGYPSHAGLKGLRRRYEALLAKKPPALRAFILENINT